jgi:hypothetical protein
MIDSLESYCCHPGQRATYDFTPTKLIFTSPVGLLHMYFRWAAKSYALDGQGQQHQSIKYVDVLAHETCVALMALQNHE